ncbi:MAG: acetate--CoA ligase family protein [Sedimentisphaerales bacterium]|nr:acetate--CoA ligase family protein [Sedimentisphaerales bacterium]
MLEKLLTPDTIAVIGASRTPGKVGHELVANLLEGGFAGTLVCVNPAASEVLGQKCHPDLKSCGAPIDTALIAVPPPIVKAACEEAIKAGAQALVVITAGFKETGPAGAELEKDLVRLCRSRQVRLLGPNCLGLINTHHQMNASFAKKMPLVGNISVLSQSGALATAILDWAAARHLGLAKLVSIGNKADLSETDFIEAFAADEHTRVIVGYLESITSGDEFIKTAESVAAHKPIVVLKAGTTAAGSRAASSHTGSLAGADIAYGAAFGRSGVIRAETFEELFDFATALSMQPLPQGKRVAIITNAGGPGIMAADAVENAGLQIAKLTGGVATALKEKLPAAASVGNPIDVLGDADPDRYVAALNAALNDDQIDSVIVILTPQAMTLPAETARAIARNLRSDKPVLACFMGGQDVLPGRAELVAAHLPDYPAPERAVSALKAMCDYAAWRKRPPRVVTRFPVNRRRVERILSRQSRLGLNQISEVRAKEILRAYGFNVPDGDQALSAEQAILVSDRIGYPVAMKIVSPDILHKSDLGGVRLNLTDAEAVRDAYDLMMLRIHQRAPEARLEGVYVEKMCPRGREVILGMTRDPQFGPMLMFGLGGIFVEVMKDVAFHLAPITAEEALQMLTHTRSYALLRGVRGQAGVAIEGIAAGIQRISQLVTDFPRITEMDINPFIVGRPGTEPVAADARITLLGAPPKKHPG